ncbi:MAG: AAA family ATPase [Planctomycetes bacterium]|nr:AAA family ATPase [Planctomycetota bacterium]
MLPAAERLPEARTLMERGEYFVVHAPRQTGKTTTLMALARALTERGEHAALHFSCEAGEPAGDDYGAAQRAVLEEIRRKARFSLPAELRPPEPWSAGPDLALLTSALADWSECCPRPLVLVFDEIDALRGESLRSVLRQLRAGYATRPRAFPHSVVLCGLRDVRDYKAESGGDPRRLGTSSPFNIKVESMRLGDFTRDEVKTLYGQHEQEAGQTFTPEALQEAFDLSQGQPWLVNALAREVVEKMDVRPPKPITAEHVEEAKERLILARATHLDSLVARLQEPRVRRVLEPVLAGTVEGSPTYQDDFEYVRDLGLVARDAPTRVANPIYREVIVRVLGAGAEQSFPADPRSFVAKDGRIDMDRLLLEFAAFWREHGETLAHGVAYTEVAPQIVLMAFLHRVVNGGGYVDREYGVGRGRIDLLVRWPYKLRSGERRWQREALELKVWRAGRAEPVREGLAQLEGYLERMGLEEGYLVVFDRRGVGAAAAASTVETPDREARLEPSRAPKGRAVKVLEL